MERGGGGGRIYRGAGGDIIPSRSRSLRSLSLRFPFKGDALKRKPGVKKQVRKDEGTCQV